MSYFNETPALDTTGITVSLTGTSITNGKRDRRQRSFTGRAHNGNASKKDKKTKKIADSISYPQKHGIPIFLQKTHSMITTCDLNIAEWTPNGAMFVVKDPKRFANDIIPKYFDHKKFASFARQLNFYGFRKVQAKPVRNSDIDESTMNHVTFCNENFKRDSPELLVKIQRSTKGPSTPTVQEQQRQINSLKAEVISYKGEVQLLNDRLEFMERRFSYLEKHLNLDRPNEPVKFSSAAIDVGEIGRKLSMASIDSFHLSLASMASHEQPSNPDRISPTSTKVAYDHIPITIPGKDYSNLALKLSPGTLAPHPKTKIGLPPGSNPDCSSQTSTKVAYNSTNLHLTPDTKVFNSVLKLSPATLAPHPKTKIGLPPGSIPNCISTMSNKVANDSSQLPTPDIKVSNSVLNSLPATLAPHPKTRIGLPPGSIPKYISSNNVANDSSLSPTPDRIASNSVLNSSPDTLAPLLQERILSHCFTLRGFSNESDTFPLGMETFDNPIPDEKDNNIDRIDPDDGTMPFNSQNV